MDSDGMKAIMDDYGISGATGAWSVDAVRVGFWIGAGAWFLNAIRMGAECDWSRC